MNRQLIRVSDGEVLLESVQLADTFWHRFKGLQFRPSLPVQSGVMISPCSSIHTCFMRFAIDVLSLDEDNVVVGVRRNVRPWRAVMCPAGTHRVIETNVNEVDVLPGMILEIR